MPICTLSPLVVFALRGQEHKVWVQQTCHDEVTLLMTRSRHICYSQREFDSRERMSIDDNGHVAFIPVEANFPIEIRVFLGCNLDAQLWHEVFKHCLQNSTDR